MRQMAQCDEKLIAIDTAYSSTREWHFRIRQTKWVAARAVSANPRDFPN